MSQPVKKQFISLTQAAELSPYSQDYLSLRARQKKFKAVKFGCNWVTTREWLAEYVASANGKEKAAFYKPLIKPSVKPLIKAEPAEKYIPLHEAAELCGYTQEYLGLRARQGKLKAIKFARNWVTTKSWLNEYIINFNGGPAEKVLPVEAVAAEETLEIIKQIVKQKISDVQPIVQAKPIESKELWRLTKIPKITLPKIALPKIKLPTIKLPELPRPSFLPIYSIARRPSAIVVGALILFLTFAGLGYYKEQDRVNSFLLSKVEILRGVYTELSERAQNNIKQHSFTIFNKSSVISSSLRALGAEGLSEAKNLFYSSMGILRFAQNDIRDYGIGYTIALKNGLQAVKGRSAVIFSNLRTLGAEGLSEAKNRFTSWIGILRPLPAPWMGIQNDIITAGQLFANGLKNLPGIFAFYLKTDLASLNHFGQSQLSNELAFFAKASQSVGQGGQLAFKQIIALGRLPEIANQKIAESLLAGADFGKNSFQEIKSALQERSQTLAFGFNYFQKSLGHGLAQGFSQPVNGLANLGSGMKDLADSLAQKITSPIKAFADFVRDIPQKIARLFQGRKTLLSEKEITPEEPPVVAEPGSNQGLVVVSSTGDDLADEAFKEKIKKSFSDEVRIEPKEPDSGVIVPIFREKEGNEYLYLMVPVEK